MPTVIKGQPTSIEILDKLKALNEPIFLSYSRGKDSLACWMALMAWEIPVLPVYFYFIPGLEFVEQDLARAEEFFGVPIGRYPHPSLYRMLDANVFQSPQHLQAIDDAQFIVPDLEEMWMMVKQDYGLPDAWVADGVRAADSIERRMSMSRHGIMKPQSKKVSPIADWLKSEVMGIIDDFGYKLPIDYELFDRSFDGLDYRFTKPLKEHLPEDFERVKAWFPFVELDLLRHDAYGL